MRACNFLEWFCSQDHSYPLDYSEAVTYVDKFCRVANFLNQPFKPEMITELFEGWEEINTEGKLRHRIFADDYNAVWFEYIKSPNIDKHREIPMRYYIDGNKFYFHCLPNVELTLNDFISDCQRAGIELTFNKETVKRYFE